MEIDQMEFSLRVLRKVALTPLLTGLLSVPAYAELSVSGNTISWPSDGNWYVVQNTQTLEIVCEGGTSCVVSDGEYYVNRHFPNGGGSGVGHVQIGTVVEYSQNQFDQSIRLSGNVMSFDIPGWYQVQALNTYEEICSGTSTCVLPGNGEYVVINHTYDTYNGHREWEHD